MKYLYTLLLLVSSLTIFYAQVPSEIIGINYQGIARESNGALLAQETIKIRISLFDNSNTVLFTETHPSVETNEFGLFTLIIGSASSLNPIPASDWTKAVQIKTEADFGSGFVDIGTVNLAAVPYAFKAKYEGQMIDYNTANNKLYITDGNGSYIDSVTIMTSSGTSLPAGTTNGQVLTWDALNNTWGPQNAGTGADNWGSQVVVTNSTLSGNGTTASPLAGFSGDYNALTNIPTPFALPTGGINGQILSTNGSGTYSWVDDHVGTGADNWGSQVVVTNSTLSGNGTAALPLAGFSGDYNALSNKPTLFTLPTGGTNGQVLSTNGSGVHTWISAAVNTDNQQLSISGNSLSLTNGGSPISLLPYLDNTDNQTLSLVGNQLTISGGNAIPLTGLNDNKAWFKSGGTDLPTNINDSIYTNGNVGIGTNNPLEALHIKSIDSDIDLETNSSGESSSIHFKRTSGTGTAINNGQYFGNVQFQGPAGSGWRNGARIEGSTDGPQSAAETNGKLVFFTTKGASELERMRITRDGNIGIGTNSAGAKLHLFNNQEGIALKIENNNNINNSELYGIQTRVSNSVLNNKATFAQWSGVNNKNNSNDIDDATFAHYSFTNNSGTGASFGYYYKNFSSTDNSYGIYLTNEDNNYISGNLGIGTANPTEKLEVNGTIKIDDNSTNNKLVRTSTGSANLVPIAYGRVDANGALFAAGTTDNVLSATWSGSEYIITIDGVYFNINTYNAFITPVGAPIATSATSVSGQLKVSFTGSAQSQFNFIVYKK